MAGNRRPRSEALTERRLGWRNATASALVFLFAPLAASARPMEALSSPPAAQSLAEQTKAGQHARRTVSFREALQLAARQGPDVASARAQAAIAHGAVERAWTAWQPDLSASGTFDHSSAPASFDFAVIGQGFGLPAGTKYPPPVTITATNSRYGTLQLAQPLLTPQGLFLPGVAKHGAEAADRGADEAREQVLLNVARTYLSLQGLEGLLKAAQDAEKIALQREDDAKAQIGAGTAVEISLLRAQTDTAQARVQIWNLQGQRESLLPLLEALTGESIAPDVTAKPDGSLSAPSDESKEPWEGTYGVQSAVEQVKAAQGMVRYDQFLWVPSVAALVKRNYNSNGGFSGQNTSYDFILTVNIPLYDHGTRRAARHEDDARLQQAQANLAATRAKARSTWLGARANLLAAQAVVTQAESQADFAAKAQSQVEASAKAGVSTSLDLTDADNRRFGAASAAAQARAALEVRRAEVAAAEGRLYRGLVAH
jgi:outer membrane protein TolC